LLTQLGPDLACCVARRNLETLGKAEASLKAALREVSLLSAVLGKPSAADDA